MRILFCLLLGLSGCCALRHNCTGPAKVVVDCGSAAVKQIETRIGITIIAILGSGDFANALSGLVSQLEADGINDALQIVTCIVEHYVSQGTGAKAFPLTEAERANGLAWLKMHGAK